MKLISLSLAAAVSIAITSSVAFAVEHPHGKQEPKTITVCSNYGHATCETAQLVSKTTLLLKGGTKIDCEGDCQETLRNATVDFWDAFNEAGTSE